MSTQPKKTIEQVVEELDRYPLEAFDFLREGLKFTVEKLHGEPPQRALQVHEWMAHRNVSLEQLTALYEAGDLPDTVSQAVEKLGGPEALNRHVSGQQLCHGLRDLAQQRWGFLASTVLSRWNLHSTEDFGRMVFALVENDFLQKQPHDSLDDFKDVFDFDEAFAQSFRFSVSGQSAERA